MEVATGMLIGAAIAFITLYLSQHREFKIKGDPEAQKRFDGQWKESINMERQRLKLQAEQLSETKKTNELLRQLIESSGSHSPGTKPDHW